MLLTYTFVAGHGVCICGGCGFIADVVGEQEEVQHLGTGEMVRKELDWLQGVQLPPTPCYGLQTLLAGHLRLCSVLFTFERVEIGEGWGSVGVELGRGGALHGTVSF